MPSGISLYQLMLLEKFYPVVEASNELRRRYIQGEMTPDLAYELIYAAYGDKKQALNAKMQVMLLSMPEPKS